MIISNFLSLKISFQWLWEFFIMGTFFIADIEILNTQSASSKEGKWNDSYYYYGHIISSSRMSTYIGRPKIRRIRRKKGRKKIQNKCRHIQQCVYGTLVLPWPPTTLFKDQEQCVYIHNSLSPYRNFSSPTSSFLLMIFMYT